MTIEELNDTVDSGEIDEFIQVCEARQRKELSKIADRITERGGVRLVTFKNYRRACKIKVKVNHSVFYGKRLNLESFQVVCNGVLGL